MNKIQTARLALVAAARSQLGVKYLKDAEVPNVAMHCTGLLAYVFKVGVGLELVSDVSQGPIAGFTDDRILQFLHDAGCVAIPLADAQPGDIVVWNYGVAPHHTGMVSEIKNGVPWVIHSSAAYDKVAEHPLRGQWLHRLNSVWSVEPPLTASL